LCQSKKRVRTYLTEEVAKQIVQKAREYGLPPMLVLEVMRQESAFKPWATSYKNGKPCARGLMQMIAATAGRFGVTDPYDPAQAIEGGCRYLRWLTDRYGSNRLELILAAYNAGEGAVDKYRGIPPFLETRNYVRSILNAYMRAEQLQAQRVRPLQTKGKEQIVQDKRRVEELRKKVIRYKVVALTGGGGRS
jgi:soluble lytic murein transglycosylase-like protein